MDIESNCCVLKSPGIIPLCVLEVCGSSLLWRLLPVGGVGRVACQGFLVREACISVLVGEAGSLFLQCNEVSSSKF